VKHHNYVAFTFICTDSKRRYEFLANSLHVIFESKRVIDHTYSSRLRNGSYNCYDIYMSAIITVSNNKLYIKKKNSYSFNNDVFCKTNFLFLSRARSAINRNKN